MAERRPRVTFTDAAGNVFHQTPSRRWVSPTTGDSFSYREGLSRAGRELPRRGVHVSSRADPLGGRSWTIGSGRNAFRDIRTIADTLAEVARYIEREGLPPTVLVAIKAIWNREFYTAEGTGFVFQTDLMEAAGQYLTEPEPTAAEQEQEEELAAWGQTCRRDRCHRSVFRWTIDSLQEFARDSLSSAAFAGQVAHENYPAYVFQIYLHPYDEAEEIARAQGRGRQRRLRL